MMPEHLEKLMLEASAPISANAPKFPKGFLENNIARGQELAALLDVKNGFFSFMTSLHVFSTASCSAQVNLVEWNAPHCWRNDYHSLDPGIIFFAEDVFGGQFCFQNEKVFKFDPETGDIDYLAQDLSGWASAILSDPNYLTGFSIAQEWQSKFGLIPLGKRLVPKIPFVLGGDFSVNNLYLGNSIQSMKSRANVANQIRNLPDGAIIKFVID